METIGKILDGGTSSRPATSLDLSASGTSPSDRPDVPERYRQWRLDDYAPQIVAQIQAWAAGPLWSLFLSGAPGTRKSSVAAAIIGAARCRRQFCTPERTVSQIRALADWWIIQAKALPLLVLDDLASYRATPHVHETLLLILGARYDNCRKTVITSNVNLADIGKWLDPRLADRLREGLVMFSGRESRRPTGNGDPSHAE